MRKPGDPRPAFYALQLVVEKIGDHTAVEQLDLGVEGAWAYRFETPGGPVWVAWCDDGAPYLPGDPAPAVEIDLDVGAFSALVTRTPITAELATTQAVETAGGLLHLTLDSTPVFVEIGE